MKHALQDATANNKKSYEQMKAMVYLYMRQNAVSVVSKVSSGIPVHISIGIFECN